MQNSSSNNSIFHGSLIIPSNTSFTDDIECDLWLKEIDLNQYTNSFLSNCTIPIGSIYLSRKRLSQIRQQDLSKMNITNFQHQKIIMEHIRHTLQYSFASPARLQELIQRHGSTPFGVHIPSDNEYSMSNLMKVNQAAHNLKNVHFAKEGRRASLVRRESISVERLSSFDSQVRQQIQRLQSSNQQHHHAVENLRENKDISNNVSTDNHHQKIQIRKKYVNLDEKNQPKDLATKGLTYGKMAMEYDRLLLQLKKLQYDQITYYKQIIECESASIFFHDSNSRELIMYLDESWNRFPNNLGIVGYCFHSGETVNVSNASNDDRFSAIDEKPGKMTRNLLCTPIISNRGVVLGVVALSNKMQSDSFSSNDETTLELCLQRLSSDLSETFELLMTVTDRMMDYTTTEVSNDTKK